jgi:hypothetical protein
MGLPVVYISIFFSETGGPNVTRCSGIFLVRNVNNINQTTPQSNSNFQKELIIPATKMLKNLSETDKAFKSNLYMNDN